jgi:outer membrane lipoprotein SlyB
MVIVAVHSLALAGCATTDFIPPGQVARLDGFDAQAAHSERQVETLDGHPWRFNQDTKLTFDVADQPAGGRFASIRVHDDVFTGKTVDGRDVQLSLSSVRAAKVEQAPDLTAAMIVGGMIGALLVGILGVYLLRPRGECSSSAGPCG